VVYAKAPFAGPQSLIAYLGRYTHKVAIGNEGKMITVDNPSPSQGTTQNPVFRHALCYS
jgi:hypothetical protein